MPATQAEPRPPSTRTRAAVRLVLVVLGLVAIVLLLRYTGWSDIARGFRRIGPAAFALLTLLGFCEHLLDSYALHVAMLGRIGLVDTLVSNSTGSLINTFVPLEAGEVVKGALLRQHSSDRQVIAGLVIWNYVWKIARPCALLLFFLVAMVFGHVYPKELRWPVLGGVVLSFVPYLVLRTLIRQRPAERLARLLARLPRWQPKLHGWVEGARRLDRDLHEFWRVRPRAYTQVFLLIVSARLLGVASLVVMARRLGLPSDAGSIAFLLATSMVAEYVTMLLPARLGVGEGSAFLLFRVMGLDPAAGLVMAVVGRLRALVMMGPTSLVGWLRLYRGRAGRRPE